MTAVGQANRECSTKDIMLHSEQKVLHEGYYVPKSTESAAHRTLCPKVNGECYTKDIIMSHSKQRVLHEGHYYVPKSTVLHQGHYVPW